MIDERRDTAVRVVLGVLGSLLLEFVKVEVDALVGEAKFGQDEGDLPVDESGVNESGENASISGRTSHSGRPCGCRG